MGALQKRYRDWEDEQLQTHYRNAASSDSAPAWTEQLRQLTYNPYRNDPMPTADELRSAVNQLGGFGAIGFDPDYQLNAWRSSMPVGGMFTPGPDGMMWIPEPAPETGGLIKGVLENPGMMMLASFVGGNVLNGSFGANGVTGSGGGFSPSMAGGGEVGSGYAASAPGGFGGPMMPPAQLPSDPTFGGVLNEVSPGVFANTGNYSQFGGVGPGAGTPMPSPTAPGGSGLPGSPGGGGILDKAGSLFSNPQVLGALGGGLLGGMGGGGDPAGTITVEEGIPDWLQPYVRPALDKYSSELQNFQTDPYGIMPSAMQEYLKTVQGMYLDPSTNKYLEDYYKLGAERVKGTVQPSFGHMQAFGSHSGYNEALSRGLADMATGLYGGAYERERNRQSQMTAAAPNFLNANTQAQFAPYSQYLSSVGSLGRKKDQPYFDNQFQNILGGAMAGYGLGNIFK